MVARLAVDFFLVLHVLRPEVSFAKPFDFRIFMLGAVRKPHQRTYWAYPQSAFVLGMVSFVVGHQELTFFVRVFAEFPSGAERAAHTGVSADRLQGIHVASFVGVGHRQNGDVCLFAQLLQTIQDGLDFLDFVGVAP